ncbi:MAG TPA: sigma-70 family RNA polymerase sigma factor [Blastocatellia bacterium]|nr:sigma-70 family RNA polymerase sigma factor [Blastocatellia bacterium]
MASPPEVTQLLLDWSNGDREALDRLMPVVYDELHRLAARYIARERMDHTLQPTALVHEAYLQLVDQSRVGWQNRAHFFGAAARLMRRILVDHARAHKAAKRGGGEYKVPIDQVAELAEKTDLDLIALDEALTELAALDEQQCRIVEMRYFGGLSIEETAEVLRISPATVKRHWQIAKGWLYQQMQK